MASHPSQIVPSTTPYPEFFIFKLSGWNLIRENRVKKHLEGAIILGSSVVKFTVDSIELEARLKEQIIIDHSNLECYSLAWRLSGSGRWCIPPRPNCYRALVLKQLEAFGCILEHLHPDSLEFAEVAKKYCRSSTEISTVLKVNTPHLKQRFEHEVSSKNRMNSSTGGANVRYGWHGTSMDAIKSILERGFLVFYPPRNGRYYGNGVYFASEKKVELSKTFAPPDSNGERHLLLCRLVCGNMEYIPIGSFDVSEPSSRNYDSGIDDLNDPSIHMIWGRHTKRILIEYIVSLY